MWPMLASAAGTTASASLLHCGQQSLAESALGLAFGSLAILTTAAPHEPHNGDHQQHAERQREACHDVAH